MIDISRYRCVVIDCDSVILDSNNLKTGAVAEAVNGEPKVNFELLQISNYRD
tara:strand:+ start:231 stop:386 length:156 start_codon:yes stop_codon:yes gene_type:complete